MSDFHEGRVAATFQVGHRIEDTKDAYEKEIITLEGAKVGLIASVTALEGYHKQVHSDGVNAKITIKEADVATKHIAACAEIIKKMILETETKRIAALGAIDALKRVITDVKGVWDKEQQKLKEIQEFESSNPKDFKQRPTGYMPEEPPLEEYKRQTEQLEISKQSAVPVSQAVTVAKSTLKSKGSSKPRASQA